jgi:hypothetical protein
MADQAEGSEALVGRAVQPMSAIPSRSEAPLNVPRAG